MIVVNGEKFLEKCSGLGCPTYHKFEDFARHEFKNEVKIECSDFREEWLLNNIDWYSMGKIMAIQRNTVAVVELGEQLNIIDFYDYEDDVRRYFNGR